MTNSAKPLRAAISATKGIIFATLILPLGIAPVPALAGANIQMLPPVTEATKLLATPTPCPPGGSPNILTWDGTNPISCTTGVTVTAGEVGIGTASPEAGLDLRTTGSTIAQIIHVSSPTLSPTYLYLYYNDAYSTTGAVGAAYADSGGNFYTGNNQNASYNIYTNGPSNTRFTILGNGNVGIGSSSPNSSFDLSQRADAISLPSGTTGQEPASPTPGMMRFNTDTHHPEYWDGNKWLSTGGGTSWYWNNTVNGTPYALCTAVAWGSCAQYVNDRSWPVQESVSAQVAGGSTCRLKIIVDGMPIAYAQGATAPSDVGNPGIMVETTVPAGSRFFVTTEGTNCNSINWYELR